MRRKSTKPELQEVGDGVALVPGWECALPEPEAVLQRIDGSLASLRLEQVATMIIGESAARRAWCAISRSLLLERAAADYLAVDIAIVFMLQRRLLKALPHAKHKSEFSTHSDAQFVRLTKLFIDTILNETTNLPND